MKKTQLNLVFLNKFLIFLKDCKINNSESIPK